MMNIPSRPSLYAAFDRFPSSKGAATHISHFAKTLSDFAGGALLVCAGSADQPSYQDAGPIEIVRSSPQEDNYLLRALDHARFIERIADRIAPSLAIAHFRDPWSGLALCERPDRRYGIVYEVNALPSIELAEKFPLVLPETIARIRAAERRCFDKADIVITPSATTGAFLASLGVAAEKIRVIPNGATMPGGMELQEGFGKPYILYFGALQPWQGVETLLRAFASLRDLPDLLLVICASAKPKHARAYTRLATKLGCAGRMRWRFNLDKERLERIVAGALFSVAPLTECARNTVQGCCPLKIIESMACGTPVVASDLPVVRELMADGEQGILVRPERHEALANAMRIMIEYPALRAEMAGRCRERIRGRFTWERSCGLLREVYAGLSRGRPQS
jgi:glycosyltransferase involved in cell wall biosynthesis